MRPHFLLLPVAALLACSSSDSTGGGAGTQGLEAFCARLCARQHTCISDDESTCTAKCKNDYAATGPKARADYLTGINECVDAVDCSKWLLEAGKCPSVSKAKLAPTAAAQSFCEDLNKKQKDCSTALTDLATCLDLFKVYGDPALADAQACTSKPCADYSKCQSAAFGGK